MILRLLRTALLRSVLIAPLIFMMVCLIWVFSTKEGTVFVLSLVNEQLPELQIDNIDGYLLGTLQAERVQWKNDSVEVLVTELNFDWNPLCLLNIDLCIGQLQARQLDVVVPLQNDNKSDSGDGLPEIVMPLGIKVLSAKIELLVLKIGENENKITNIALSGGWTDSVLALDAIEAEYQQFKCVTEGKFDFSLPWKSQFKGDLSYELPSEQDIKTLQLAFKLNGEQLSFDINGDLKTEYLQGNIPLNLSASISFDDPDFPLLLTLESPAILAGDFNVNAFSADASLKNLSATINSRVNTPYWSELGVSIDAQWFENTLLVKRADIQTESGKLSLQGQLSNTPMFPFQLTVNSTQLALHYLTLPNAPLNKSIIPYPVFIDSEMKIKGLASGEKPQIDLVVSKLEGTLNHKPVAATGHFNVTSELLTIDKLMVKSGNNKISGRGASNDKNHSVKLNIFLPEPELWVPDVKGRIEGTIEGNGQLNEALSHLDINGMLKVTDLTFKDYALQLAQLDFDVKQSARELSVLNLSVQNLKLGDVTFENTQWQLKGNKAQAELQANLVVQGFGEATLQCDVMYITDKEGLVEGVCDELNWLSNAFPDASFGWRNKDKISLNWNLESRVIALDPFCLGSKKSEVCNSEIASWGPEKGYTVSLNAEAISLQRQQYRWPELFKLNGLLSASVKVSQKPGETVDADIIVALPKGKLSWVKTKSNEDIPLQFSLEDASLKASMHNDQLSLNSYFTSSQLGDFHSQLTIADLRGKRTLSGNIGVDKLDLSFIGSAIPSITAISGMISSQLTLSGALTEPFIEGDFTLSEGELKTEYFPETIRNITVAAHFDQQTLNYKGDFESNSGKASLEGALDWQEEWVLKTSLESDSFEITPRPGFDLTIKPALSLLLKDGEAKVSGTLNIPRARVEVQALPEGAKSVSQDVRVVGQEAEDLTSAHWKYNSNINIILGDDVHFRGFGVNTYLTGNLLLSQTENGALSGTGQVLTEDGFYTILGQRLTVKEGRFNFSGPLDEPDLQLDATRTISVDNITVGVRVTGSVSDPEVEFYSQPVMNESTVLHYLLTGKSPDKGSNSSSLLNNMVLSAGVFGSSEITEELANKVGVSDFQVATSADEDGSSLELSGYISPDIYLKYGVSLYDDAKTMAMRYRLKQNLFIEAAGGINSSLDIIYSFEHR